jgi:hypothetical protein
MRLSVINPLLVWVADIDVPRFEHTLKDRLVELVLQHQLTAGLEVKVSPYGVGRDEQPGQTQKDPTLL